MLLQCYTSTVLVLRLNPLCIQLQCVFARVWVRCAPSADSGWLAIALHLHCTMGLTALMEGTAMLMRRVLSVLADAVHRTQCDV